MTKYYKKKYLKDSSQTIADFAHFNFGFHEQTKTYLRLYKNHFIRCDTYCSRLRAILKEIFNFNNIKLTRLPFLLAQSFSVMVSI